MDKARLLITLNQAKLQKDNPALYQFLLGLIEAVGNITKPELPIGAVLISTDSVPVSYGRWALISTDTTLIVGTTLYFWRRVQ